MLLGIRLDVSLPYPYPPFSLSVATLPADRILPSNVVLTLSNGGKAGTIYMLMVAIFGLFFVCLCESELASGRRTQWLTPAQAMAEMASMAPTA